MIKRSAAYLLTILVSGLLAGAEVMEPVSADTAGKIEQTQTTTTVGSTRLTNQWKLVHGEGALPAEWRDPRCARLGENLSQMISTGGFRRFELAQRVGKGEHVEAMSGPTLGSMEFTSKGLVYGYTLANEALVVKDQAVCAQVWARFTDNGQAVEVRYRRYVQVVRALRCGNDFRTIGLVQVTVPALPADLICFQTKTVLSRCREAVTETCQRIHRQVERALEAEREVMINLVGVPAIEIVFPNPVIQVTVQVNLPPAQQVAGVVPMMPSAMATSVARPGQERTLASASVGWQWYKPTQVVQNNNQSQGQNQSQFQGQLQAQQQGTPPANCDGTTPPLPGPPTPEPPTTPPNNPEHGLNTGAPSGPALGPPTLPAGSIQP